MRLTVLALLLLSCATPPTSTPVTPTSSPAPSAAASARPCPSAAVATLNAALWMQTSAEHDAVLAGIYAGARQHLDAAIADRRWTALDLADEALVGKPPAVILDLDETAIDTSASTARLIKKGVSFSEAEWSAFALAGNSRALAPALEFLRDASSRGVAIFYITNRSADQEPALRSNLAALGFPLSGQTDVILTRGERPEWSSGDKSPRREFVARHYRVMMLFGDDLNDFSLAAGKSLAERNEIVRSHASWWGTRWFALPNPMYGSWERAVTGDATGDCAQFQRKLDALRTDETYVPSGGSAAGIVALPLVSSERTSASADLENTLATALRELPAFDVLVAGKQLDSVAREAAAAVRRTIALDAVPQTASASLPAGYARLDRLDVQGDTAHVTIWYGTVPKVSKGTLSLDCGTGHSLELRRSANGTWQVTSRGVSQC